MKPKHRRRLKDWSKQYGFREGGVNSVADLFEPSAVISLVNEVVSIQAQEKELYGDDEEYLWLIGITGGTMHMAAAGTYAGVLLNSRIFYVIQPPEGVNQCLIEMYLNFLKCWESQLCCQCQ